MNTNNRPWSEIFKEAASDWTEKEAAAQLLEDTKSAVMAQMMMKAMGPDVAYNKVEAAVKASSEWYEHVEKVVEARRVANLAKVNVEFIRMRFQEWSSEEANHRAEMRL